MQPCRGAPHPSQVLLHEEHRDGDTDSNSGSTGRPPSLGALPVSRSHNSPEPPDHHEQQQRYRSSSPTSSPMPGVMRNLSGKGADAVETAIGAGTDGGGGGDDTECSVTRQRPGAWSLWADDDESYSPEPERMSTTGGPAAGTTLLQRTPDRKPKAKLMVELTRTAYTRHWRERVRTSLVPRS